MKVKKELQDQDFSDFKDFLDENAHVDFINLTDYDEDGDE